MNWKKSSFAAITMVSLVIGIHFYTQMLKTKFEVERALKNQERQYAF